MPDPNFARHNLAWLAPGAVTRAELHGRACIDPAAARVLLAGWIARGHPLIVTRQPLDAEHRVALGLALPPSEGKWRLGFLVDRAAIAQISLPPTLMDARASLPAAWSRKVAALLASPAIRATQPRIYGSAAMQAISGEECLGDASDLDLSLAPRSWSAAQSALAALAEIDAAWTGPRLDGEIAAPDGGAVAWRELRAALAKVLVKRLSGVDLETTTTFISAFPASERRAA